MNESAKYFQPEILSRISRLDLRARHVVEGFVSGMHKSPYKGFSVEFANHRAYVPGDDIRHIDWRVYAKADRFFIKEYEEETNMRVQVLLDCSGSMAYPAHPDSDRSRPGRMTKWDYAATLAVSLAYLLTYQQDAVGLTLFDREIRTRLPASTNPGSLRTFAEAIERSTPIDAPAGTGRGTDFGAVFENLASSIPRRGLVVILSDLLSNASRSLTVAVRNSDTGGADQYRDRQGAGIGTGDGDSEGSGLDKLFRGLERFRYARQDVIVLHVLDHDELTFPFADRTLFEGMEAVGLRTDRPDEVLTDPQSLRASYLGALTEYLRKIRSACLNQRIDYTLVSTAENLDVALTTFLATRMHRQRAKA